MPMRLTTDQLEAYRRDGFIVVEDMVRPEEVEALRNRVSEYSHGALRNRMREYTPGGRPLGSIMVQIEPRVQRGELKVEHPGDGIRKIEGLVEGDDLFRKLGLHENIVGIVEQILGPDIKIYRSTLLLKPPEVGSAKGWHQDSPYWPFEPMALCSCWFPLDDATPENGCMVVIPGWHKKGPLPHVRGADDHLAIADGHYDSSLGKEVPMRAGSGLFLHSLLPHYTAPNRSRKWRRAILIPYMSAKSRYTGEGESPVYFHVKGKTYPGYVR